MDYQAHDAPVLVAARRLKPLGNQPPHSVKFFAASELLEPVKDRPWLGKVTDMLNRHRQNKNAAKKNHLMNSSQNGRRDNPRFLRVFFYK